MSRNLKVYFTILKRSLVGFFKDNGPKLGASLSFFTIFSLGPALLIVLSLLGIFFGKEAVEGRIFGQIEMLTGALAAKQIQEILKNIELAGSRSAGLIIGAVILFIGATGVFTELQDSLNYLWSVKPKPKKGILRYLVNRVLSFSILLSFAFILLVSLVIDSALQALIQRLFKLFPESLVVATYIINLIMTFVVTTSLFCLIFKILPDALIKWKDAWKGAILTSLLFMGGKFAISYFIAHSRVSTIYGTATAIIILLSWVYYSSFILFFGAVFTRERALVKGGGIRLKPNSVFMVRRETKAYERTET